MPLELSALAPNTFRTILARRPDPLGILSSTAPVVRAAEHVRLVPRRIETVAQVFSLREVRVPAWNYEYHFFDGGEDSVAYIFLLDALNFSFWGEPRWGITYRGKELDGYWGLAAALKRAAERDQQVLAANFLADITPAQLARILRGRNEIPMLVGRWRSIRELGRVLRDRFAGSAARMVESAAGDAPALARRIADTFASFDDTSIYRARAVTFLKRAQILVADLYGCFGGRLWGEFRNIDELTAFSDYKLPQILRAWGILRYDAALARRVDGRQELGRDSEEEIEIRACTLWGVELLRAALARRGRTLSSLQMDWFLWESSQHLAPDVKPYHRVRTIFY